MNIFKHLSFRKKKGPKVLIKYGRLIDYVFTYYSKNSPDVTKMGWSNWTPPTKEEIDRRIKAYREEWKKYTIIRDISRVLGLSFERNIIDVYIVSGISRASSDPIIIKSGFTPKEFVVTLAHELIHRILTENKVKKVVYDNTKSEIINNHVIVYAVLKKILDEELWNIASTHSSKKYPSEEYAEARLLMEEIGADRAIKIMTG